ncbi:MAG: MerR family transcriptional regulator [Anaerolineales bacterium]
MSIADLPDEPKFTIKAVCARTGIRPVTLRAWERRYEILTPYRSDNRYRLYSERDVALLRWIKSRVDDGISISSAANELRSMVRNGLLPEAVPAAPTITKTSSIPPKHYASQLYQALIEHNEGRAGEILHEAQSAFDLQTILTQVITPALVEIGLAWYHGKIHITTEHFASSYLRGRLLALLQAYSARRNAPRILIGCAPDEQHELGSLMFAILLRSHGYRVEFLGPDIPLEDLLDYASYEHPDMIILAATMVESAQEINNFNHKLKQIHPTPLLGYGGAAFQSKPELRQQISGIYLGDSLEQGVIIVSEVLKPNNKENTKKLKTASSRS